MEILIPLLLFLLALLFALLKLLSLSRSTDEHPQPYRLNRKLLSDGESVFYEALHEAISHRFLICPKVRLADIIDVSDEVPGKQFYKYFNRIRKKHFDFVLCDPATQRVECVIELDDKSHNRQRAMKNDRFKNEVCEQIELPLIRFKAKRGYNPKEIALLLEERLSIQLPPTQAEHDHIQQMQAIWGFQHASMPNN